MKKFILIFVLIFIFSFMTFADGKICLIPDNNRIFDLIQGYFSDEKVELIKADFSVSEDSLLSGDKRLFEYIKSKTNSDLIFIPLTETLSGFTHKRFFVYEDDSLHKIYESLDSKEVLFNSDIIIHLLPYITEKKLGLLQFESIQPGTSVYIDSEPVKLYNDGILLTEGKHTFYFRSDKFLSEVFEINIEGNLINSVYPEYEIAEYHNLSVNCPVEAEVYNDGILLGNTPLKIESYTLPLILRFHSDGYSDRVVSIDEPVDSVDVNLNILEFSDPESFKKNQNSFYRSFMRSLALFGAVAFVRGSFIFDSEQSKTAEKILDAGIVLSLVDVGFDLFKYYKSIKNIAP